MYRKPPYYVNRINVVLLYRNQVFRAKKGLNPGWAALLRAGFSGNNARAHGNSAIGVAAHQLA